jgi:ABC-type phosphate transport system permease subunit
MTQEFIIREVMVLFAIIFCLKGQYDTGSKKQTGWIYMIIGGFFWGIFAVLIESPMSFINNIMYILFSIRGLMIWRKSNETTMD